MSWPTIQEVIAHLKASGEINMATVVESLVDSEKSAEQANRNLIKAFYELKDKYEPRQPSPSCWKNNWTGD